MDDPNVVSRRGAVVKCADRVDPILTAPIVSRNVFPRRMTPMRPTLFLIPLLAAALPLPAQQSTLTKLDPPVRRSELIDSATELPPVEGESLDPADRTPLPVEMPEAATHLPDGFALVAPFEGEFRISNGYGYESPYWTHRTISNEATANDFFALDISMPTGTPILAPASGRVITSDLRDDSYGNYMVIDHGEGITSVHAHLDTRRWDVDHASPEVWVEAGEPIATSGASGGDFGPHLHFAVHTGSQLSHSGADVGGLATVPEPMGGRYGLRAEQRLTGGR